MSNNSEFFVRESKSEFVEKDGRQVILYFGNPLVDEDLLALKVGRMLRKNKELQKAYKFIECLKPEDFFDEITSKNVIILDVAENTDDIVEIEDPDLLSYNQLYSAHQQNLAFYLKLFRALGEITTVRILTIPFNGNPDHFSSKISDLLLKTLKI
jgi:Ni,Fe-hydrogenase maturation factor